MSGQHHYSPPREQLVAVLRTKTMPDALKKGGLVVGVLGMILFVVGAATGEARAWQAFLMNWLFFTTIASAAVMFAAVQRIVTARWSRGVIRFLEGFVAFLPIAAVGLLVIVFGGKDHIYPWWNLVGTGELRGEGDVLQSRVLLSPQRADLRRAARAADLVRVDVGAPRRRCHQG
jgi:hypothetical protein